MSSPQTADAPPDPVEGPRIYRSEPERGEDLPVVPVGVAFAGPWRSPGELIDRLPPGYGGEGRGLVTPTGHLVGATMTPMRESLADVAGECVTLTEDELAAVETAPTSLTLVADGGSVRRATRAMAVIGDVLAAGADAAIVLTSGGGFTPRTWADVAATDAGELLAFTTFGRDNGELLNGQRAIYSSGLHALGWPDAAVPDTRPSQVGLFNLQEFISRTLTSGQPPADGEAVMGIGEVSDDGTTARMAPCYRARLTGCPHLPKGSPRRNPWGTFALDPL